MDEYITYVTGKLPIIICSPHGGYIDVTKIPTRKEKKKCSNILGLCHKINKQKISFVTTIDGPMSDIVYILYNTIFNITNRNPYLIVNNVKRGDIDTNRPISLGTENDLAENIWNMYFDSIKDAIKKIKNKFGKGLLIDLHAYDTRPTNNREIISVGYGIQSKFLLDFEKTGNISPQLLKELSITQLLTSNKKKDIKNLLYGKDSLGSLMCDLDVNAYPSRKYNQMKNITNFCYYRGGYTTQIFKNIIPTIQLEFPQQYLKESVIEEKVIKVAIAILLFMYNNGI